MTRFSRQSGCTRLRLDTFRVSPSPNGNRCKANPSASAIAASFGSKRSNQGAGYAVALFFWLAPCTASRKKRTLSDAFFFTPSFGRFERFVYAQKQLDRIMRMFFRIKHIRYHSDIVGIKKYFQHLISSFAPKDTI